jgi:AraC-like DNA-binding protein
MLVGTVQGFIFAAAVLFSAKYRTRSNYYLVGLILSISLNSLQYYLRDFCSLSYFDLMGTFYIPYASLNCTLLFLYVKTFLYPEMKITLKNRLLFIPFLFFLLATTFFKILLLVAPSDTSLQMTYMWFANMHEFFAVFYSLALIIAVYKLIVTYQKETIKYNAVIVHQQLLWLKVTLALLFVIIVIYAYLMVKVVLFPEEVISFYSLWIFNSFMIYWLGHIGIYKFGIQKERQEIRNYSIEQRTDPMLEKKKNSTINALEKLLLEDQRFLDSQLSLESIAAELGVSKGHLSRLVNAELNTSFSDYVNLLRVNTAKAHLTNPEFSKYTLSAIGLESGFNSRSTFYSTFKKVTNCTPAQFRAIQIASKSITG